MRRCSRCGGPLDFDVGGDGICMSCEAAGGGSGGFFSDVPCQRCGMYLPSHELQMWNSRQYCQYCIMDLQDEERIIRKAAKGMDNSASDSHSHDPNTNYETCSRCGRQAKIFYTDRGRRLCETCHHEEGGAPSAARPFPIRIIVSAVKKILGIKEKPKIIQMDSSKKKKGKPKVDWENKFLE